MNDKIEKVIKIVGHQEDVHTLCEFLRHVEYLGNIGASRNLLLRVDGDGSGRLRFYDSKDNSIALGDNFNIEESRKTTHVVGTYDIG